MNKLTKKIFKFLTASNLENYDQFLFWVTDDKQLHIERFQLDDEEVYKLIPERIIKGKARELVFVSQRCDNNNNDCLIIVHLPENYFVRVGITYFIEGKPIEKIDWDNPEWHRQILNELKEYAGKPFISSC